MQVPWREWPIGARVVVRYRLPDGWRSDALGELLESSADGVVIRTRRGDVRVAAADIELGKIVPPAPLRRRRPAPPWASPPGTPDAGAPPDPRPPRG